MKFTKMHGLGNDYIFVNCISELVTKPEKAAKILSDRHTGVGADGLILIMPSKTADFQMRMFNADGSSGEMCGNGIRCLAKYVYERGLTKKKVLNIETGAGIREVKLSVYNEKVEMIRVDMGRPILNSARIPIRTNSSTFINKPFTAAGEEYHITGVSMGNPHIVIYVDGIEKLDISKFGPIFEHHEKFPERTNVEFAEVLDKRTIKMRVWERGSGETMACGTGACAVLVSSVLNHLTDHEVQVKLLGGDLSVEWDRFSGHVYMTGPAAAVFDGEIVI